MPTLPTLDVSQAHFDRLVAAFPGETLADKAAAYRAWLTNALIDHVEAVEAERLMWQQQEQLQTALQQLRASLPPRVPVGGSAPVVGSG